MALQVSVGSTILPCKRISVQKSQGDNDRRILPKRPDTKMNMRTDTWNIRTLYKDETRRNQLRSSNYEVALHGDLLQRISLIKRVDNSSIINKQFQLFVM